MTTTLSTEPRRLPRLRALALGALLALGSLAACGETSSPEHAADAAASGTPAAGGAPSTGLDAFRPDPEGLGLDHHPGRFRPRHGAAEEEAEEEEDPLSAIGYSAGSQPAPAKSGVTQHDRNEAYEGLNFFVSGHAPGAWLMDMDGHVLHEWHIDLRDVWPNYPDVEGRADAGFWRRAHLYENGDVLAIFESLGIVKLDRDSKVLWSRPLPIHHDLQVMENGDVWTLARTITYQESAVETLKELSALRIPSKRDPKLSILEDFVGVFAPDGTVKDSFSLYDCFENSAPEFTWKPAATRFWGLEEERDFTGKHRDIFHTNSIEVLDGRIEERVPEFAKGNVLVSLRHLDTIAVVDPEAKKVVWTMTGASALQHDAQIDADGNLLFFDNQWRPGRSRIAIVDPLTRELVWEYGTKPGQEIYSETCGTVQELPNGNLLISVTDNGRALEITRDGKSVWEFFNPFGVGENEELIASLFELVRLDGDFPTDWISER